jgi:hypothetical protein
MLDKGEPRALVGFQHSAQAMGRFKDKVFADWAASLCMGADDADLDRVCWFGHDTVCRFWPRKHGETIERVSPIGVGHTDI